jgi:hypothetical protein
VLRSLSHRHFTKKPDHRLRADHEPRTAIPNFVAARAPGAYDCITARSIAQAGFDAVYMTGAGTAATLDYPDYGLLTMWVASMASGGMDTLPHNGAVIILLAVTGLSHRQPYKDIFAITWIKTISVFVVIAVYYSTGIV